MKRPLDICGTVLLCLVAASCAKPPLPIMDDTGKTAIPKPEDKPAAPVDAAENDQRSPELPATVAPGPRGIRRETLMCTAGTEDRHARIGVELENDEVIYFAFYSKWRPRTCSIEAGRGDPASRWTGDGTRATVTLPGKRGRLRIEREGSAYRFAFIDVDRVRYCGMQGKINGSLTVMRGKSSCLVKGVMDGHSS